MTTPCSHPNAVAKKYVGTNESYMFCPDCLETFGGEETPAKRALIEAAAIADERGLTPDDEHGGG